jgi:hypothetical protein
MFENNKEDFATGWRPLTSAVIENLLARDQQNERNVFFQGLQNPSKLWILSDDLPNIARDGVAAFAILSCVTPVVAAVAFAKSRCLRARHPRSQLRLLHLRRHVLRGHAARLDVHHRVSRSALVKSLVHAGLRRKIGSKIHLQGLKPEPLTSISKMSGISTE